jgi:prepilin-type N-terminal cleavage/methylation domain-containing protein
MQIFKNDNAGFTLIELSIVLVIIGLIVGGVLVGQDLIRAAYIRAQISQIEKFNTAVNTFRGKYNALPGDLNADTALQYGFTARGQYAGEGDGDGIIEGIISNTSGSNNGRAQGAGETVMFWQDLTYANGLNLNLIEGSFTGASPINVNSNNVCVTNTQTYCGGGSGLLGQFYPDSKFGANNRVYVYSLNGVNYYGVSPVNIIGADSWLNGEAPNIPVRAAYMVDSKVDDGFAQSGNVMANYVSANSASVQLAPSALSDNATTCFNTSSTSGIYSTGYKGGVVGNCVLSFKFQ